MTSLTYNPIPFDHTYILYDPTDIISILSSFFSLLPIGILIFYFSWLLLTREIEPIIIAGGQVINDIINGVIKHMIKQERPRPELMSITSSMADSSHFKSTLGRGLEYGMPSAHSQFMGFFMVYFSLRVVYQLKGYSRWQKLYSCSALAFSCFAVVFSRVYLMYHTVEQVVVGVLVGICLGSGYFLTISIARDVGFIGWIVDWPICKYFWLKDSCYECPLSFEDEYQLWVNRKKSIKAVDQKKDI